MMPRDNQYGSFQRVMLAMSVGMLLAAIATIGCEKSQPTLRDVVIECVAIERTQNAAHGDLQQELRQIELEGGLPQQIARSSVPDDQNAAVILSQFVDPKLQRGILERTEELFPDGRFDLDPIRLAQVRKFSSKHEHRLEAVYAALSRPQCRFEIDAAMGFFEDHAFVDDVTIASRLLSLEAAQLLDAGEVAGAVRPFEGMLQLAAWLAQERVLTARVRAAEIRAEALLILEAIVGDERTDTAVRKVLGDLLDKTCQQWTSDAESLRGERAMVLHTYEALRRNLISYVLTAEEKQVLADEGLLETVSMTLPEFIDEDELFYLSSVRPLIEQADRPFFERLAVIRAIQEQADAHRQQSHSTIFASRMFLPELPSALEVMARDRARCEAWALALAAANGGPLPDLATNPHTGRSFRIERQTDRVIVFLGEPDERDPIVPLR